MTVSTVNNVNFIDIRKSSQVLNSKNNSLAARFRALFELKSICSEESIVEISKAFKDDSILLKHEVAYVLGQMKNKYALSILYAVLKNLNEDCMVRHEAAEAIAAIGDFDSIPHLEPFLNDSEVVVRETIKLALDGLRFENTIENDKKYNSIDPAPPYSNELTVPELHAILLDVSIALFERYRAMFALRDIGNEASVLALADGLKDNSALFRHEIAYVFGQMQHPSSTTALIQVLENENEMGMVRHEAAEGMYKVLFSALGSIATPECIPVLKRFSHDSNRVVRESCIVGLDILEFNKQ